VDDSAFIAKVLSNFLKENGYKTEVVATGEDAIEATLKGSHIDLIIMDIELAGTINGIEAAHKILQSVSVPIIFLTANASKEIMKKTKEIQAYGFVLKGGNNFALLSSIEMAFNLYEAKIKAKQFNEELAYSRKQYLELSENAPVGILKCDKSGNITFANQKAIEILGSTEKEETMKINLLNYPPLVDRGLSKHLETCLKDNALGVFEMDYESRSGKNIYIRFHIKPFSDKNEVIGAQVILDDITEMKSLEEELRRLSLTDPLTNTYNRRYFIQKLEEEIDRIQRQGCDQICISLLDIDHFKNINDCFGHDSGDLVLNELTETIKKRIRKIDCLARWGGEEFIILLPCTKVNEALLLIEELRKSISKMKSPVDSGVTASFGVAEYRPGDTVDSLINRADRLMYAAKEAGRNCVIS